MVDADRPCGCGHLWDLHFRSEGFIRTSAVPRGVRRPVMKCRNCDCKNYRAMGHGTEWTPHHELWKPEGWDNS